jgi:hypothetical protein
LGKANCKVVQKNLTTDFVQLGLIYREEVTKLLEGHDALVWRMQTETKVVAKLVVPAQSMEAAGAAEEEDDEETADEQEHSILHVLNEDKVLYLVYSFNFRVLGHCFILLWVRRMEHDPTGVP